MYSTDNLAKLTADKLNVSEHQRMNDSGKSVYTCILRVYRNCAVIDFGLFLWPAIYYMAGHIVTMRKRGSAA